MDDFHEKARKLEEYFEHFYKEQGEFWLLGLYMSKQWIIILEKSDFEAAKFLWKVLDAEGDTRAFAWVDLKKQIDNWLYFNDHEV